MCSLPMNTGRGNRIQDYLATLHQSTEFVFVSAFHVQNILLHLEDTKPESSPVTVSSSKLQDLQVIRFHNHLLLIMTCKPKTSSLLLPLIHTLDIK